MRARREEKHQEQLGRATANSKSSISDKSTRIALAVLVGWLETKEKLGSNLSNQRRKRESLVGAILWSVWCLCLCVCVCERES